MRYGKSRQAQKGLDFLVFKIMKKIIISSYDSLKNPFYGGGGALMNYEIGKRLSSHYNITILCGAYPQSSDYNIESIHYKHIGMQFKHPLIGQLVYSFLLPFYALIQRYDLWIENYTPPHSTNFIPFFTKKPVIGLAMMLDARKFSEKYKLPFYLVEQFGIKQYKYIITLTESLKKSIQKVNHNSTIEVISGGISKELLTLKTSDGNYALFIGRIDIFQKGLDFLLESWSFLVSEMDMPLFIAGNGTKDEEKKLMHLIEQYGLKNKVILKGKVAGKEKKELLANCKMVVCPSRFETFGISALEGLACGKPVITFGIDGFSWIPNNLSIKSKNMNAKSFAEAVTMVVQNKKLRNEIEKSGPLFAKKYTWDNLAKKYDTFIRMAL